MKAKVTVTETVSEKMDLLQQQFEANIEEILQKLAVTATGKKGDVNAPIPKRLMFDPKSNYNPYLYTSGQEESRWLYDHRKGSPSVSINYSGLGLPSTGKVWIEFSKEFREAHDEMGWEAFQYVREYYSPRDLTLDRDYAFFQETGIDEFASPDDAKHKHFVREGLRDAANEHLIENALGEQMKKLFEHLK